LSVNVVKKEKRYLKMVYAKNVIITTISLDLKYNKGVKNVKR
jgi:hypothetical protein